MGEILTLNCELNSASQPKLSGRPKGCDRNKVWISRLYWANPIICTLEIKTQVQGLVQNFRQVRSRQNVGGDLPPSAYCIFPSDKCALNGCAPFFKCHNHTSVSVIANTSKECSLSRECRLCSLLSSSPALCSLEILCE